MYYHTFLVSRELTGGGLVGLTLAKWMSQQGISAPVWIPGDGSTAQASMREGLPWQKYDLDAMSGGKFRHALACLRMVPRLQFGRGWAHIHVPIIYRLLRPVLRLTRMRTAVSVHIDTFGLAPKELCYAFQDPPDLILPCARYMINPIRQALGEAGEKLPIAPLPNAVDTERFFPGDQAATKRRLGAPAERPLALMLANLAPYKRQETAIRAVAELKRRGTDLECWLAGADRHGQQEYRLHLQSLVAQLGVGDRVRFLGFRTDSPDLLRAADFLLLPSIIEGLPLCILEAQASKVPVLAAPTAGVPEVVTDGETGFLIPADDVSGYANRMEDLLRNPDLRQRIIERAFTRVTREHTMTAYCQRVQELLQIPEKRRQEPVVLGNLPPSAA